MAIALGANGPAAAGAPAVVETPETWDIAGFGALHWGLAHVGYAGAATPLIVLTATDHASPPEFEREWQRIPQIAAQPPRGRQVIAEGSGHYVQDDRPEPVVEQIRQLLRAQAR